MAKGGARPGSGPKPKNLGRVKTTFSLTPAEKERVQNFIKRIREVETELQNQAISEVQK